MDANDASTAKGRKLGTVDAPASATPGEPGRLPPTPTWAFAAWVSGSFAVTALAYGLLEWARVGRLRWASLFVGLYAVDHLRRLLPGLAERRRLDQLRKEAKQQVKFVRGRLKKLPSETVRTELAGRCDVVDAAAKGEDAAAIEFALEALETAAAAQLPQKGAMRDTIEQVAVAILIALFVRAFFYEAFRIPSQSMVPTLLVGDHLFVNKFTYGLRIPFTVSKVFTQVPKRGDIVVFNRPGDEHGDDIIKRVIGLPGDRIDVRDRHIWVNGEKLEWASLGEVALDDRGDASAHPAEDEVYERFSERVGEVEHVALAKRGALQGEPLEGSWIVLPEHLFVMGDNRDNSQDSRFSPRADGSGGFGQVPLEHVKGRADFIWLSIGGPRLLRFERMFTTID